MARFRGTISVDIPEGATGKVEKQLELQKGIIYLTPEAPSGR